MSASADEKKIEGGGTYCEHDIPLDFKLRNGESKSKKKCRNL